jgi:cation transport ATPase
MSTSSSTLTPTQPVKSWNATLHGPPPTNVEGKIAATTAGAIDLGILYAGLGLGLCITTAVLNSKMKKKLEKRRVRSLLREAHRQELRQKKYDELDEKKHESDETKEDKLARQEKQEKQQKQDEEDDEEVYIRRIEHSARKRRSAAKKMKTAFLLSSLATATSAIIAVKTFMKPTSEYTNYYEYGIHKANMIVSTLGTGFGLVSTYKINKFRKETEEQALKMEQQVDAYVRSKAPTNIAAVSSNLLLTTNWLK